MKLKREKEPHILISFHELFLFWEYLYELHIHIYCTLLISFRELHILHYPIKL